MNALEIMLLIAAFGPWLGVVCGALMWEIFVTEQLRIKLREARASLPQRENRSC